MADDRVVTMSASGYKSLIQSTNGKGLHWATDVHSELPVKIRTSGSGSERPITVPQFFLNQVKTSGEKNAVHVERGGKALSWTWNQYYREAMNFAKAMHKLQITERSAVAIMGFNSPEWVFSFMGGLLYNSVITGIYATNAPEACHYQVEHSDAEVIVVETNDMLKRFTLTLKQLPKVKAIVVWGEKALPAEEKDPRFFLWKDFLKLGASVADKVILEKLPRMKPGECSTLIYTSGTTGMPKGCMLSHDSLVWESIPLFAELNKSFPDFSGNQHRIVSYLPLSHIAGLSVDVMSQIFTGHEVYFARPDALAGTLVQTLQWARPTIFFAVPRVWEKFEDKLKEIGQSKPAILQSVSSWAKGHGAEKVRLQQQKKEPPFCFTIANTLILTTIKKALGLDQAKIFFFGAAPLKQASIDYFASLDMPLFNVYGMSETTGSTTVHAADNFRLDSAGFAIPGCDLKIDKPDENGEGEICMRGRNTMMGYLKNEQATIETIDSEGFVHSGDKGKIEKDGHLKITGRFKELIITGGGENISPVPIEDNFKISCPPCSNIMMVGEMQRFMACIVTFKVDVDPKSGQPSQKLAPEAVNFFKKELGLDLKTSDDACKEAKVVEFVQKCIEATNKKSVSRAAHIRKFKLVPVDFSIPGGELTATLKLKRKVTEKKYQAQIDEMFAPDAKL